MLRSYLVGIITYERATLYYCRQFASIKKILKSNQILPEHRPQDTVTFTVRLKDIIGAPGSFKVTFPAEIRPYQNGNTDATLSMDNRFPWDSTLCAKRLFTGVQVKSSSGNIWKRVYRPGPLEFQKLSIELNVFEWAKIGRAHV